LYRHGVWSLNVTKQNGGLHAARAVGLHPAVLTEGKAFQLLTEVFHHIVAFGFAVDQHVQAECFLFMYAALNFCVHSGAISKVIQFPGLVLATISADFFRLGERTYRGGREEW